MTLSEARNRVGLSQRQVAEVLSISGSAVCQWEKGLTRPKIQLIEPLASLYKLKVEELLRCF